MPLNEVWGMNPRDSSSPWRSPGPGRTLNEVWGMNPRDSRRMYTPTHFSQNAQRSLGYEPQRQFGLAKEHDPNRHRSTKSGV